MSEKHKKPPKAIKPPDIPDEDLSSEGLPGGVVRDRERYEYLALSQYDLSGQNAEYAGFETTRLSHVNLTGSEFTGLRLTDVRLENCDLANTELYKASLQRTEIADSRMVGLKACESEFQDVLFKRCKGRFALFRFAIFKSVRFEDCDLTEADFEGSDLSGVTFSKCDLSSCEMTGAKLVGADFRGSNINGLKVGLNDLRGAIVDPLQALDFVRLLGLVIKAEYE